jgi:hypothetical protein
MGREIQAQLGRIAPRDREVASSRHCEEPTGRREAPPDDRLRDEAIHSFFAAMDCFAALAMTVSNLAV